jgi:predicted restriction endonuclease
MKLRTMAVVMVLATMSAGCTSGPSEYDVQITCEELVHDHLNKDVDHDDVKNPPTAQFSAQEQSISGTSGLVTVEKALASKVTYEYRCSLSGDTVTLESMAPR